MNSKHSNKELWQLLASFILPITAAFVLYSLVNNPDNDVKIGTMNYGTLIKPPVETTKNDIVFFKKNTRYYRSHLDPGLRHQPMRQRLHANTQRHENHPNSDE